MKIGPFVIGKDGGKDSTVDGVLFEIKGLFSVGVLRFQNGSREAFHSHAFNCWSVLLRGVLTEEFLDGRTHLWMTGDFITTHREDVHEVSSFGTSYVLTFRGAWSKTWFDVTKTARLWRVDELSNGRQSSNSWLFDTRRQVAEFVRSKYNVQQ